VPSKLQQQQLKALGANIRRERMRQEMTQERLAELVELNVRTVQKVEAGNTNILVTTFIRFQMALKCGWNKLLPSD
jgi:transcriptional regulator with XRE-family HTH domain